MAQYQLLIKNVKIIDGISDIAFRGDIAVKDEKIVKVGDLKDATADKVVDGTGLTACPGFFDIHTHTDRTIMNTPTADNLILQGITCALGGHCGSSSAPAYNEEYFNAKDATQVQRERTWTTFDEYLTEMGKVVGLLGGMAMLIGILIGIVGIVLVCVAYPIYNGIIKKEREKIAPEIIRLADELMN